jgi:mannosyltransferase
MASGTAVVTTRAGAFESLVEDGETGLLVETGNLDQLTAGLDRLMADPDLAAGMGRAGRARAASKFSISGEADAINRVYESVWAIGRADIRS